MTYISLEIRIACWAAKFLLHDLGLIRKSISRIILCSDSKKILLWRRAEYRERICHYDQENFEILHYKSLIKLNRIGSPEWEDPIQV